MAVWHLIKSWWYARQRQVDVDVLWPICLREAQDLDRAKAAFCQHAMQDPAWTFLGEDAIIDFIERLEAYD